MSGPEQQAVHLRAEGLERRFGARRVLEGATLEVRGGETVALLGENGSGKSTLLQLLAGVLAADAGVATLDGLPLLAPAHRARARVGYVPEAANPFPWLSAGELLDLVAALKGTARVDDALVERLGVVPLLGQRVGALSLGQRRRTGLCAALTGAPSLLLLDEPTNGLDGDGVRLLAALLDEHRGAGGATLLATHDRAFAAAVATRGVRVRQGRLEPVLDLVPPSDRR